jgi:hypothetical protein
MVIPISQRRESRAAAKDAASEGSVLTLRSL